MSFAKDINALLRADPSLWGFVGGNIFYENIPDNFSLEKPFLVYSFVKGEPIKLLSGIKVLDIYTLTIKIVHKDTALLDSASLRASEYLDNISSGNIRDMEFQNDEKGVDLEKKLYQNEMTFSVHYEKN